MIIEHCLCIDLSDEGKPDPACRICLGRVEESPTSAEHKEMRATLVDSFRSLAQKGDRHAARVLAHNGEHLKLVKSWH